MAVYPFWWTDTLSLSPSGSGNVRLEVAAGEKARFKELFYVSSGSFNVIDIFDATGKRYSNASSSDPITSTMLRSTANTNNTASRFEPPLELDGPNALVISVTDTSGAANTVRVLVTGEKEAT
jgi:hypothetical protein